jgi:hypothetical protein
MKKFLILIIGLILFCSCEQKTPQQIERENYEYYSKRYQSNSQLFELTFKDEYGEKRTHQFVEVSTSDYMNGIDHWPDCKYCKARGL